MKEVNELEELLPEGWVWEAGNKPDKTYWAQALGSEVEGRHPSVWGYGATLEEALDNLIENLILN